MSRPPIAPRAPRVFGTTAFVEALQQGIGLNTFTGPPDIRNPSGQFVVRLVHGGIHIGRQYRPVLGAIGERVVHCVIGDQKIEGGQIVLLNDNLALDDKLLGGRIEGRYRNGIVLDVTMPAQSGGRRDVQARRFDAQLMALSRTQAQLVRFQPHGRGKIIIGAMENLEAFHRAFYSTRCAGGEREPAQIRRSSLGYLCKVEIFCVDKAWRVRQVPFIRHA